MGNVIDRKFTLNDDGVMGLANDGDKANEREVAALMARAWKWKIHYFGSMDRVDFWAEKDGKMRAVIELKSRTNPSTKFETVFLSSRKWYDLTRWGEAHDCEAIFVVKFTDVVMYIPLSKVDPRVNTAGGRAAGYGYNDHEPLILVPVADMLELKEKP
jgi:hypothetical protein